MSRRKPADARPFVEDLPVRYTAEIAITYRVWDALQGEYLPGIDLPTEQDAQAFAERMEASRPRR